MKKIKINVVEPLSTPINCNIEKDHFDNMNFNMDIV